MRMINNCAPRKRRHVKKMSSNSASLQHILISVQEYDRLKSIEKQYQKLHEGIEEKLQITSRFFFFTKLINRDRQN